MEMERRNMEMERKNMEMEGSGMEEKEGIFFYHQSYFVSSSFDFLLLTYVSANHRFEGSKVSALLLDSASRQHSRVKR